MVPSYSFREEPEAGLREVEKRPKAFAYPENRAIKHSWPLRENRLSGVRRSQLPNKEEIWPPN